MPATKTATKSAAKSSSKSSSSSHEDAVSLLTDDHKKVKKLFKTYEQASKKDDVEGKVEIAHKIFEELTIHTMLEEEIFYPAARAAIKDDDLLNEATVEHDTAKDLIAQLEGMDGDDPMYDAKMTVLSEYIDHHVEEEETEMFPKAKKSKMDLDDLGAQMVERKEELIAEIAA